MSRERSVGFGEGEKGGKTEPRLLPVAASFTSWSLFINGVCHTEAGKLIVDLSMMQIIGPALLLCAPVPLPSSLSAVASAHPNSPFGSQLGSYTPFIALVATSSLLGSLAAVFTLTKQQGPAADRRIPSGGAPVAGWATVCGLPPLVLLSRAADNGMGSLSHAVHGPCQPDAKRHQRQRDD